MWPKHRVLLQSHPPDGTAGQTIAETKIADVKLH